MKKLILLFLIAVNCFAMGGTSKSSVDAQQARETERMVSEASRRTGLPNITKFTEKRFQKMIYELRDREVKTYSYFMDMNGRLHFLCNSIGYGIPASVQYVNPERIAYERHNTGVATLPQPEPNGLFMPDSLDATYVLCADKKGKLHPVYSEPKLIVSPFPLQSHSSLIK